MQIARKLKIEIPDIRALPRRALIGTVHLRDCRPFDPALGRWAEGPFCFVLTEPQSLPEPLFMPGALGFWSPKARPRTDFVAAPIRKAGYGG